MAATLMTIRENLTAVRHTIQEAAGRGGRRDKAVDFILVTKGVSLDRMREAYDLGERKFGENRVQELLRKKEELPADIEWHLVGHLQTNKVRSVIPGVALIHSLDSERLAVEMEKRAAHVSQRVKTLIQVNVSRDPAKFGVLPEGLSRLFQAVADFPHIDVVGLMGIGPLGTGEEPVRACFRRLADLRKEWTGRTRFELKYLSMGMSDDYELAVEEGANLLRLGRAIFGERGEHDGG